MILFNRTARLASAGGLEWAASICEFVNQGDGPEIQLWSRVYSPGYGTIGWSGWFEDIVQLEAFGDGLLADAGYQALVAKGAEHVLPGTMDDNVYAPVHGAPSPDRDITYVRATQAVLANGNGRAGMAKGIEIAEHATTTMGVNTMFMTAMAGPYGSVGWLSGFESAAELQDAGAKIGADEGFAALVDGAQACYVEGTGMSTVFRRAV